MLLKIAHYYRYRRKPTCGAPRWEWLLDEVRDYYIEAQSALCLRAGRPRYLEVRSIGHTDSSRSIVGETLAELDEGDGVDDPTDGAFDTAQRMELLRGGILLAIRSPQRCCSDARILGSEVVGRLGGKDPRFLFARRFSTAKRGRIPERSVASVELLVRRHCS